MPRTAPTPQDYATVFAALSEPIRIRMLQMIGEHVGDDLPCTELDKALPIAKSTISYHVQILRRAELISVRKAGRNYFYQLQRETFDAFVPGFLDHLQDAEVELLAA